MRKQRCAGLVAHVRERRVQANVGITGGGQ